MESLDWIDIAIRLYERGGKKTYHVRDLADLAGTLGLMPIGMSAETFSKKISVKLNANTKTKTAQFAKVKNKSGGYRQGTFRLKSQKPLVFTTEQPKVATQCTGAAGEYAVLSELLFRGFNASKMTVDDGIDVVASKEGVYFHVQVKTANDRAGTYLATIKTSAFQHASNVFYIIVMRTFSGIRYVNDYVILQSGDLKKMVLEGKLKDSASMSLRLTAEGNRLLLNGGTDVSVHRNNWDLIC
ncbi:hypothetical protein [Tateyamaria sp.]|uniref:hypothetical protein n=1 Tax=Tateyamaria sp. TaxID=1929288 RepID=UPI00329B3971